MTPSLRLYPCPCCTNLTLSELGVYEICEVCGWEDDPVQSADPTFEGGANEESLTQARKRWEKGRSEDD